MCARTERYIHPKRHVYPVCYFHTNGYAHTVRYIYTAPDSNCYSHPNSDPYCDPRPGTSTRTGLEFLSRRSEP